MVKFMHLRSKRSDNPIGCIAYSLGEDNTVRYSVSIVNPEFDRFNKDKGRAIAADYLKTNSVVLSLADGYRLFDAIAAIMENLSNNNLFQLRAREVALKWVAYRKAALYDLSR